MSAGITATTAIAVGGMALSAAGTAATMAGQSRAAGAASAAAGASAQAQQMQAEQQQAWKEYDQQIQARAMAAQADWARSLAEQRQVLAQRGIDDSLQRGEVAAKSSETQTQLAQYQTAGAEGAARARLAARGTDLGASSGGTGVLGDIAARGAFTTELGQFNTATIRANAAREAYGHRLELAGAQDDAAIAQAQKENAIPGLVAVNFTPGAVIQPDTGLLQAGTALAGASSLASQWWKFQQAGAFGGGGGADDPRTKFTGTIADASKVFM